MFMETANVHTICIMSNTISLTRVKHISKACQLPVVLIDQSLVMMSPAFASCLH